MLAGRVALAAAAAQQQDCGDGQSAGSGMHLHIHVGGSTSSATHRWSDGATQDAAAESTPVVEELTEQSEPGSEPSV